MNKRKVISVVLSLCMLLSLITPALAADTASVKDTPSPWAAEKVALAIEAGIVPLHLQGDYQKDITRYEIVEILVQLVTIYTGLSINDAIIRFRSNGCECNYKDINSQVINSAYSLGIIRAMPDDVSGERYFHPDENITRKEMAVFLYRTAKLLAKHYFTPATPFEDENLCDDNSQEAIQFVKASGIVKGTGENLFEPLINATREQVIITAYTLFCLDSKDFNELGAESLLYASNDVHIENDYFILHIEKGSIYSKDIENHILEGFKAAEEVTGLSLYPPEYKNSKIILEAVHKMQYIENPYTRSIYANNLIINSENNAVIFAGIASKFLLLRNASLSTPHYYPAGMAYEELTKYLVNEKLKQLSTPIFYGHQDAYLTPEQFNDLINSDMTNIIRQDDMSKEFSLPISFSFLFLRYVYEKYGMATVNRLMLEITNRNISSKQEKFNFITKITDNNIKYDIVEWYSHSDGKYVPKTINNYLVTDNFMHLSSIINIDNPYHHIPAATPYMAHYNPLCFSLSEEPVYIDLADGYKLLEFLGYRSDNYVAQISGNETVKIKVFDSNGSLVNERLYIGMLELNKNGKTGSYIEITGSGICELYIYKTQAD